MRLRTLLIASALLAAAVVLALWLALAHVTRQSQAGLAAQAESQQVARTVANLLSLTYEFSVYGSDRSAAQWRSLHAQLAHDIERAVQQAVPAPVPLQELRAAIADLPLLFEALGKVGREPASAFTQRRRDLLIERLLTETREVVEARHRWASEIGQQQRQDQQRYTTIVLAVPAALLLILMGLGVLVWRRVLRPLATLQHAVVAMQAGDLTARCASRARDELGDTARAVDAMALALQQQSVALRASEQHLRLVADNLPALVAHIDAQQRYTFVNAASSQVFGVCPEKVLGQTMRAVRGDAIYRDIAPHVQQALRGEPATFEGASLLQGRQYHYQSTYVPDLDEAGQVRGFFAMTFDITARKQAELRQADSERRLVDITDNLPALVAYLDTAHRYRFANANYQHWLGIDHHQMPGRTVADVLGAQTYALVRPNIERALAGERVQWTGPSRRRGQPIHFLAEYIPDFGPDGQVRGCYALTMDITQHHDAELELARSQRRLLDLTNSLPAMVGYFDLEERCQYANDTALRSQGLERSALTQPSPLTLRKALGDSNYAQHEPYVREVLKGRRARLEGKVPFQGREAHFQAHFMPDRVDGGALRGFYLMTFDITALKEAQQRQARVERQLRAITDNLPALISYIDRDGRFAFANAAFKDWLGVDPAALVGHAVADVLDPQFHEPRRAHILQALAGQQVTFDAPALMAGRARHLHSVFIPDIQPDGRVEGIYTISTDVTPMKEVEQRLSAMAHVDALTGLPNRRQLSERLPQAMARAARSSQPLAVMFLDIDRFKAINDSLGHAAGDAVLVEFGRRLKSVVRVTDVAARLAGDEFVLVLEGIHAEHEAALVAEKIVSAVRRPFLVEGQTLTVTTSIGVAYGEMPVSEDRLMASADAALYAAKAAGRDTYRVQTFRAEAACAGGTQPAVTAA